MVTTNLTNNYTKGRTGKVLHIVIHTMEAPEGPSTAENIANYFKTPGLQASAHYCIDNNSTIQCVRLADTAWACPGYNASGIQYEHAGYAAQTAKQWQDDYSQAMLHRSAKQAAIDAAHYGIPVRHLTIAQVRARNVSGFMGHRDATYAGVGGNTHTDPGVNFPWSQYLSLVKHYQDGTGPAPAPAPKPTTSATWIAGPKVVTAWQRYEHTTADGIISRQPTSNRPCMPSAHWTTVQWVAPASAGIGSPLIRAAQKRLGVTQDGFAGPVTWKAIQRWLGVTADGIAGNKTIEALAHKVGAA